MSAATTPPRAHPPGSGLGLLRQLRGGPGLGTLMRTETRMFLREPMAIFWAVVFPIVLLVVIGASSSGSPKRIYGGLRFIDVYTPVLLVFVFGIVALQVMPATLVSYRQKGYLRRLSTTPVGAARVLEVQWIIYTGLCLLAAIVTALAARLAFSVHFPTQFLGFLVILLLTAAAMLSVGTLIASLASVPRASQLIGALFFYPMMFFAGLWGPQQDFGPALRTVAHCLPLSAAVNGIESTMAGRWPHGWVFLCLLAWTALATRLAVRVFRWE